MGTLSIKWVSSAMEPLQGTANIGHCKLCPRKKTGNVKQNEASAILLCGSEHSVMKMEEVSKALI